MSRGYILMVVVGLATIAGTTASFSVAGSDRSSGAVAITVTLLSLPWSGHALRHGTATQTGRKGHVSRRTHQRPACCN